MRPDSRGVLSPLSMPWLYRLQSRAGLTGPEGTALVVLVVALAGGVVARHAVASAAPPAPQLYAAADAAFARVDTAAAPVALVAPAAPSAADSVAGTAVDSSAVLVAEAAVEQSSGRSSGRKPPPVPTNINTAGEAELQRLPRVGPAIAARIVAHRQTHGRFGRPEDIQEVKGIGPKTFEKMAPWIRL